MLPLRDRHQLSEPALADVDPPEQQLLLHRRGEIEQVYHLCHPHPRDAELPRCLGVTLQLTPSPALADVYVA